MRSRPAAFICKVVSIEKEKSIVLFFSIDASQQIMKLANGSLFGIRRFFLNKVHRFSNEIQKHSLNYTSFFNFDYNNIR
jgi:hypothetical protein